MFSHQSCCAEAFPKTSHLQVAAVHILLVIPFDDVASSLWQMGSVRMAVPSGRIYKLTETREPRVMWTPSSLLARGTCEPLLRSASKRSFKQGF
jgi:hypothetical protein